MKVYSTHSKIQDFLKNQNLTGISVVDDPKNAHYLLTGRYSENDYHENLHGIIIPYTGHNGIDLDAMRNRNLRLFVTPTRSKYVAEKAVALTLSLLGKVVHYHNLLSEGNWAERNSDSRIPWESLQGKSVGLYGYGRIGKIIHKMLKGFDCEFYTVDRQKDYPNDIGIVKNITNLVQVSDVIIISVPLNESTKHTFDQQLFNRMKNKYLINVGRGNVIDEDALYDALISDKLRGFASDVWYNYPKEKEKCFPSKNMIHELPNVVMSNHSGGYTLTTNEEVNTDIINTLKKIKEENFEDQLDLKDLL